MHLLKKTLPLFLLAFSLQTSPVFAKTHTYRDSAEVSVTDAADRDLGIYLASLVSFRRAAEQAIPLIASQPFVKEAKLSPTEIRRLAYMLTQHKLSYTSDAETNRPLQVVHKTKLEYDPLKFPESMGQIYQLDSGNWILTKYRMAYESRLEVQIRDYLQQIQQAQDPAHRRLLRETQGAKLLKKYKADQLKAQATELANNDRFEQAIQALDQATALVPDYPVYGIYKAFLSWTGHGKKPGELSAEGGDAALKVFSELIEKHPQESDLYTLRAAVYMIQGTVPAEGLKDTITAVELDENNALAYLLMGILGPQADRTAIGQQGFEKACELGVQDACGEQVISTPKGPPRPFED